MTPVVTMAAIGFLAGSSADGQYVAGTVATDVRDNVHQTADHVVKWWKEPPPGEGVPHPVATSYCYHVLQDTLCYRQPVPGWEYRLVGYQGTHAVAPSPVVTQPLSVSVAGDAMLPEQRVAHARPVFSEIPKEPEKTPTDSQAIEDTGAAHETLPDPALAPQL